MESRAKSTVVGSGVGRGLALGARARNRFSCKRERESAIRFSAPGICEAVIAKLYLAATSTKWRINCIIAGEPDRALLMVKTVA